MVTPINNPIRDSTATRGASKLRALGDEARMSVLIALLRNGPQNVSRLQEVLGMEQSLLSHHLRTLRMLGLVHGERQGRQVVYAPADSISIEKDTNTIHLGCCSLVIPKSSLW
jgi:DNA-binding transcriptional ArsR family regulator